MGLVEVGSFQDHEGFDGVMLGTPGASYHLEFTRERGHVAGGAPTKENLLVFYLPAREEWQAAVDRMVGAGYAPVASYNPYWDRKKKKAKGEILRSEYRFDYSKSKSNRFATKMSEGTVAVVLEPDVAAVFKSSEAVNALLRSVISAMPSSKRNQAG